MQGAGNLFVVSGPSGVGKGTIVEKLIDQYANTWLSVSLTTRKPRSYEQDGREYRFVSDSYFDSLLDADDFLEWAHVHSGRYGTQRTPVQQHLASGDVVFLEIDVQGGFQVRKAAPDCHLVFIEPPSMEELRRRLEGRGTETPEQIESRMKTAEVELSQKMQYDTRIVNDNLDAAVKELVAFVRMHSQLKRRNN